MPKIESFSAQQFSAMQEGKPLKRYRKTILGKVCVLVLNPFSGEPEEIILEGNPNNQAHLDDLVVDIWDVQQDQFFLRFNKTHFQSGTIEEFDKVVVEQASPNVISDDDIREALDKPFLALKALLNKFSEVIPVYRVLTLAEEMEKSEKILNAIRARATELELEPYGERPGD
ncbi:hypothetical protein LCGC14_0482830 [marine sediment metagenome]|uniref:Uncharacterized protein n=1 Tax=marine sediment metagenome TaxID=412755 RepID=A0A0F9S8U0_9ZZZZ|nr:hypothetical protein [bacterium]